MAISEFAKNYHEKMFPGYVSKFLETDPEFLERFDNFAFDEVIHMPLADNCFGDDYTRTGLDYAQREMITFCFILAQGGYEPQLLGHAKGNFSAGNDKAYLIQIVSQCVPFIGYPRTLNALAVIQKASEE